MKISIPIFDKNLWLYVGEKGRAEAEKKAKRLYGGDRDIREGVLGATFGSVVWLAETRDDIIVHESVHFVTGLMEDIGSSCDETRAYLTEYVVMAIRRRG